MGQGRLYASVLPENKQAGCTKEHSVRARWRCNRINLLVRGDAFGTEFLPDSFTTDEVLYLIMYMLMFSGAIVLRYKMKKLEPSVSVSVKGGNGLMWLVGGLGFCGSLLAFVLSFIPPSQISTGSNTVWFSVLSSAHLSLWIAPFIIYASKKPSWVDLNSTSNRSIGKNNKKLHPNRNGCGTAAEQPLRPGQTQKRCLSNGQCSSGKQQPTKRKPARLTFPKG